MVYRKYAHAKATSITDVVETFPPFDKWLHSTMCMQSKVLGGLEELGVYGLSIPFAIVAKLYRNMSAYNNHFRVALWLGASNMATYNLGVVGEFEHTPCVTRATPNFATIWMSYVGECKKILELDYGVKRSLFYSIHGFEPQPATFKLAQRNMSLVSPLSILEGYC
jgi:hypothetical protein